MATVFKTNTVTFVPLIVAFKVMSISNELVMTDFEIDHANNVTDHSEIALGDTYNDCRQAKKPVKMLHQHRCSHDPELCQYDLFYCYTRLLYCRLTLFQCRYLLLYYYLNNSIFNHW